MKTILGSALIAMVLLSIEAVLVKYLGLQVSRIDISVALVAFIAIRSAVIEGAVASFTVGYLLDLMSGRPTGLFTFLAVLMFLFLRLADTLVEVRRPSGFAMFAAGAELAHGVLAAFFSWLTSKDGHVFTSSLAGLPLSVPLTGLAAFLLFPLFKRLIPQHEGPQMSLLR